MDEKPRPAFASDAFKEALENAAAGLTPKQRAKWEARGRPTLLDKQVVNQHPNLARSRMGRLYTLTERKVLVAAPGKAPIEVVRAQVRRLHQKTKGKAARRAEKLARRQARERAQ